MVKVDSDYQLTFVTVTDEIIDVVAAEMNQFNLKFYHVVDLKFLL